MSEIPEDIIEVARVLNIKLHNATELGQRTQWIAEAILAERKRHSAVRQTGGLDAETIRQMIADGKVFADTNPEAQFISDADLSCPHCGGSGHKDDVRCDPEPIAQKRQSGITERQRDLIAFIRDFKAKHGFSPSFVEMAGGIGISSKSGVARLVSGLEERGVIRRLKDKNRSVSIVGEFLCA